MLLFFFKGGNSPSALKWNLESFEVKLKPTPTMQTENSQNPSSDSLLQSQSIAIKNELLQPIDDFNVNNHEDNLYESRQPNFNYANEQTIKTIKDEPIMSSPATPEKINDTFESDEVESVLAEALQMATIKPISSLSDDTDGKIEKVDSKKPPRRKKRRNVKEKSVADSDSSDDDGFSSANVISRRSRSKSSGGDQEKKKRGRPRQNPCKAIVVNNITNTTPNKKESTKKLGARRRISRQSSTIKSRPVLSTTDSDDDDSVSKTSSRSIRKIESERLVHPSPKPILQKPTDDNQVSSSPEK